MVEAERMWIQDEELDNLNEDIQPKGSWWIGALTQYILSRLELCPVAWTFIRFGREKRALYSPIDIEKDKIKIISTNSNIISQSRTSIGEQPRWWI